MAVAVVLTVGVGLAVIVGLALLRYPRDQWRDRLRTTSHMIMNGVGLPRVDGRVPVREVTLDQMWAETSKTGNAYWEIPSLEDQLNRVREASTASAGPATTSASPASPTSPSAPIRASITARFPQVTSLHPWQVTATDSKDSERTVA